MALSIMRNGVPLDQIYGTKGPSTAIATGLMQNGVDVNQSLLALADGKALGFNSGYQRHSADFSTIFGIPNGNTPLPINGQTFTASSQSATGPSNSSATFNASTSGWLIFGTSSSGGLTPNASGSIPSGAVSVQYSYSITESAGSGSVSNGASSITALSGAGLNFNVLANSTPSTGDNYRYVALTINFFNGSGTNISTTNITLRAVATGSA